MPRISMTRFRDEILSLYEPPLCARNSWFKIRQVLDILDSLGVKTTTDLTPSVVARFVRSNPDWAPATVEGLLGYLSPVCKYAKTMGYVRVNPFDVRKDWYKSAPIRDDDDQADDRFLSIESLSKLLSHLESQSESWQGMRLYALVSTFAYTGLRRNEGLTRAVEDFDLARQILRLKPRKIKLKTRASVQPVGLPAELVPILERWLPMAGSSWAFPATLLKTPWTGGPMGKRPIDELKAAGEAAGIGRVTFQALRHTWATIAEARGIGELMIQRQLRHTSRRTQLHYRHADEANIASAVDHFTLRVVRSA